MNLSEMEIVGECPSTYEGVGDTGRGDFGSNYIHERWLRRSSALNHSRINEAKEDIKMAQLKRCTQQWIRTRLAWGILKEMEGTAKDWG